MVRSDAPLRLADGGGESFGSGWVTEKPQPERWGKWESRRGCGISKGRWGRWETGVWFSTVSTGPPFPRLSSWDGGGWANLAGGCVAARNMGPISDRQRSHPDVDGSSRCSRPGDYETGSSPAASFAFGNGDRIVFSHHALGLNGEDPVQVRAGGASECGSFFSAAATVNFWLKTAIYGWRRNSLDA